MTRECTSLWVCVPACFWDGGSSSVAQVAGQLETGFRRPAAAGSIWDTGTQGNTKTPDLPWRDVICNPSPSLRLTRGLHWTWWQKSIVVLAFHKSCQKRAFIKKHDGWESRRGNSRRLPTCEMSITESQLRGRAEVKSLKPSRVDMIPFWSMRRIMVPSTKKITPYLSTVMPGDKRQKKGMDLCREDWMILHDQLFVELHSHQED